MRGQVPHGHDENFGEFGVDGARAFNTSTYSYDTVTDDRFALSKAGHHTAVSDEKGPKDMLIGLAILLVAIALGAAGQLLLKTGVNSLGADPTPLYVLKSFIKKPVILGGFACYGVSSLFYLVSLSKLDLSYAYPMIALSYVIVAILSYKYLGEGLPFLRIVGIVVIIAGVTMVALSHDNGASPQVPQEPPAAKQSLQDPGAT
ncbi:MAG: hypothetical protein ACLFWB_04350 [Armatimonadota bacterium]